MKGLSAVICIGEKRREYKKLCESSKKYKLIENNIIDNIYV